MVDVVLVVGGQRFSGWKEITLIRSMEKGEFEFDLVVSNRWKDSSTRGIKEGDAIKLYLGNELLVSGFVDARDPQYDAENHSLLITGRSVVGDLVDCSTTGKQFKNQTLLQIAEALCKPFGINVVVAEDVDVGAPFKERAIDEGQPIWEFLEQAARVRALRLMSTPEGNLLITQASEERAAESLELGRNIRRASAHFSLRSRYSHYIVLSNQERGESLQASDIAHPRAEVIDTAVKRIRYRPLVIVNDDPANLNDCRIRADWQRNTHYGRGNSIVYTVGGWQEIPGGKSWRPNTRVYVDDSYAEIKQDMQIVEVRLKLTKQGRYSELKVMPPEALALLPLPEDGSEAETTL